MSEPPRPLPAETVSWPRQWTVASDQAGQRLDVFLAGQLPSFSRATLRRVIDAGRVHVGAQQAKASLRLRAAEVVVVDGVDAPRPGPVPLPIPLSVLHEDDAIIVVDKPAGMVVHPAKGHWDGTLASALAFRFGVLSGRGGPVRPGIVHRLDRDTSGVIVVAKNDQVHDALAAQFKSRQVEKEYLAIVVGVPDRDRDVIDEPIGDHPTHREKKAIHRRDPSARPALTQYEVLERFFGYSFLRVRPKTGRTHQIRVHLAHVGFPILCDRLYGGRAKITELELLPRPLTGQDTATAETAAARLLLDRQALHAHRLSLTHPIDGKPMHFVAPLAADVERTLASLRRWRAK